VIRRSTLVLILFLLAGGITGATENAPEFRTSGVWINSTPLTLKALKGKVVLVDFWAFDCAPCLEAMPHIQELYSRYESKGLVIVGVHVPRTRDEKNISNVREAVKRMEIRFPVVTDNSQKIWSDYRCDVWPTVFVIDRSGAIRYSHGGVGRYDDLENSIQTLLDSR
jgi:thiol-disulfide isomerase/thioredoxin